MFRLNIWFDADYALPHVDCLSPSSSDNKPEDNNSAKAGDDLVPKDGTKIEDAATEKKGSEAGTRTQRELSQFPGNTSFQ